MRYFARMNPLRAVRDLRLFLADRQPYELWFGILSITITFLLLLGFLHDSRIVEPYQPPEVQFVEQWPATRTDAEIRAAQKITQAKKDKDKAIIDARDAKTRAMFKRMDEQLDRMGI